VITASPPTETISPAPKSDFDKMKAEWARYHAIEKALNSMRDPDDLR
jgi:hypothetical protein